MSNIEGSCLEEAVGTVRRVANLTIDLLVPSHLEFTMYVTICTGRKPRTTTPRQELPMILHKV